MLQNISLNVKDLPNDAKGVRFALVSDMHAGATVFKEQIEEVFLCFFIPGFLIIF